MTQSIREVADEMGMVFDEDVLSIAEDMERRNAAIAQDFAEAWGGVALRGAVGRDTSTEQIVHRALLTSAADMLGHAVVPPPLS